MPTDRTPAVIAGEIAAIKAQTRKILLISAVEVGRRLQEAKELIPYGEYGKWLENDVDYSERVAYKLIQIAEEYGPGLSVLSETDMSTVPLAKLGYSQAYALLGIPAEERAEFIAELDIEHLSVSALQQAIMDRNNALEENSVLAKKLGSNLEVHQDKVSSLTEERDQAKKEADVREKALWEEQSKVTQLQRQLAALQDENIAARRIKEIETERDITRINHAMALADARYDLIVKGFNDLFSAIKEMAGADPKATKLFINQTNDFIAKTARKLKQFEKNAGTTPLI
ncbi:DUF3102 domain-containing protein [Dehalobacter sp. DCM]|uniref:DUF3102 domain-containing protein n=1 Tax=Dehalobacter sp. DCM TaxID=2907827 RepID=UPI00308136C5